MADLVAYNESHSKGFVTLHSVGWSQGQTLLCTP